MKKKSINIIKYWVPVLLWALVIFAFSSFPTGQATQIYWQDFIVKKTAHVIEYAILTTLSYRALIASGIDNKKAAITAVLASVLYGFSDEYHQSFTAGREPRVRDVGFDTIGALFAIYGIWIIIPKAPKKLRELAVKLELA